MRFLTPLLMGLFNLCFCFPISAYSQPEPGKITFCSLDHLTQEFVHHCGDQVNERVTPCSTFKIPLCLMGFDAGILIDEETPRWIADTQDLYLDSWKGYHTPRSWLQHSVVWYSLQLTPLLGRQCIEQYLADFSYGNQDISGDPGKDNALTQSWICSSLKISPAEQVVFLDQLVANELPLSIPAQELTKSCLYEGEVNGVKIYAKTGSGSMTTGALMWYVGYLQKEERTCSFALLITDGEKLLSRPERRAIMLDFMQDWVDRF